MENLFCVIMAGGIGSRFWPMSREKEPKQFIDIMGSGKSFIRHTYERFATMVKPENFVVVTSENYKNQVLEHIPEITPSQVLCEPMRRNTAPCIAYAAYHIKAKNPNATMVVTPSDHLVLNSTEFERVIKSAVEFTSTQDALMTIGIHPSRPETGYGYIQIGDNTATPNSYKVKTFTEKPQLELAKVFLESGEFFWNSGIFIWSVNSILKGLEVHTPNINALFFRGTGAYATSAEQQIIKNIYPECENISIDYSVMEKADNVYVICADFGWSDVGTWGSLMGVSSGDENGNVLDNNYHFTYNTSGSVVRAPQEKVVVVDGLKDYIVADNGDSLLICPIKNEQKIKEYVERVKKEKGTKYI